MRHWFAAFLLAALACPCSAAEELVTIPTRNGVTLSYLLDQDKAAAAKVVVISFVGAFGAIGLERRALKGPARSAGDAAIRNWMLGREFAREIQ